MKFMVTMECNKEDAAKAKKIAEEKIRAGDFVGAHKFVTTAQRLFPNLENILQMKAICDVHSSATNKIKGLDNWYGVLQVQPSADADTIRKQYRKLALLLHPDKNKCAGAEAAFKLIGEANRWLSDQIKRSQYDVRYRSHLMFANKYANTNSGRNLAPASNAAENMSSVCTFWTRCKHCGHCYKYLGKYINTVMHCSTCRKSFVACNIRCDGMPTSSSTAVKKEFQDQGIYNISRQNASTGAESESLAAEMDKNGTVERKYNKKHQENHKIVAGGRVPKKDDSCTENAAEVRKSQNVETAMTNSDEITKGDVLKPQHQVKEPQTSATKTIPDLSAPKKDQAAKKTRKAVEESSKSSEIDGSDVAGAKTDTIESKKRKSSRKKPQIPYAERGSNGDFVSPPNKKTKSGREFESNFNTKDMAEDIKSSELADSGVSSASSHAYKGNAKKNANSEYEDILSDKNKESEGCDGNGEDATLSSKIDRHENGYKTNENPSTLDIPGPEFNVFEVERKAENFAVNQVWSTIDPRDGMPRKYALVKKVPNAEFKLRITYLEPVQDKNGTRIPVACGKFKNGKSKEVKDRSIFSGLMYHLPCSRFVSIYPRKGEIWAIFRDWDDKWNTGVEKHQLPYKYDFVEILSDFHDVNGLGVAYLGKLKGSVSLFHREAQNGICQIQFPPDEMLRFSHKVPAVKMIGEENKRVSADSYKLDPAALPKDICQVDEVDVEMDNEIQKGKADGLCPEAPKIEVKAKLVTETAPSLRKRQKYDDDNGVCSNFGEVNGQASKSHDLSSCQVDEKYAPKKSRKNGEAVDVFKLRKSPRLQKLPTQRKDEIESAKQGKKMSTPEKTDKGTVTDSLGTKKSNNIHQAAETREGESPKKQGRNGELPSLSMQNDLPTQLDGSTYESPERTLVSSNCKTPQNNLRSEDRFQVNQIWAIYGNDKEIPSDYVKIKKIETEPNFVLRGNLMELYPRSSEPITRPVTCGEFKLKNGRPQLLPLTKFSHQVKPFDSKKKNMVKIYPREDEIWVLYKNCDSTKEEYDIVEVVEDHCDGEIVKVVALTAKGFSSLHIYQRKQGTTAGLIVIPKAEMSRFSHRIPAVRHLKRTTRLGEGEYWELDPIAIPGCTKVAD